MPIATSVWKWVPKDIVINLTKLLYPIAERIPWHITYTRTAVSTKASKNHWMNRSERINNLLTNTTSVTFHTSYMLEIRINTFIINSENDKMAIHVDSIRALNMDLWENLNPRPKNHLLKKLQWPFRCLTSKHIKITL